MEKGPLILSGVYDGTIIIQVIDDSYERIKNLSVTLYGNGRKLFCEVLDLGCEDNDSLLYALLVKQHTGYVVFTVDDRVYSYKDDLTFTITGEGFNQRPEKINIPIC